MNAPNAEAIEAAADSLRAIFKDTDPPVEYPALREFLFNAELKELDSAMGGEQITQLQKLQLPTSAKLPHALRCGYLLGLQTARISLQRSVKLIEAELEPGDIL